jgi:hypothetical protein
MREARLHRVAAVEWQDRRFGHGHLRERAYDAATTIYDIV